MGVLLRVAAAWLIAIPNFLVLVIVFVLAGRRSASLPLEGRISRSLEREALGGPALGASRIVVGVSH